MLKQFLTVTAFVFLTLAVFGQVDTLRLVEQNNIEVPGTITKIYTKSIRDNYKEIFICTADHIYVYDSRTNDLIWSRGELIDPRNLLFEDINNDGFIDLAFQKKQNKSARFLPIQPIVPRSGTGNI